MASFSPDKQGLFSCIAKYVFGSRDHKLRSFQGFILELLFLQYINDIPQAPSDSHTYLYVHNASIFYQHKNISEIENVLNKEFANVPEWFADNKLLIHFGEDKTKCTLFS